MTSESTDNVRIKTPLLFVRVLELVHEDQWMGVAETLPDDDGSLQKLRCAGRELIVGRASVLRKQTFFFPTPLPVLQTGSEDCRIVRSDDREFPLRRQQIAMGPENVPSERMVGLDLYLPPELSSLNFHAGGFA